MKITKLAFDRDKPLKFLLVNYMNLIPALNLDFSIFAGTFRDLGRGLVLGLGLVNICMLGTNSEYLIEILFMNCSARF